MKSGTAKKSAMDRFLDIIEKGCNMLPPPTILFCWLFLITGIIGAICTAAGVSLKNPATGEMVMSSNLFTKEGLLWFLSTMLKNFTDFAPLGLVLCMTLGIGLCEESGLLITVLKSAMKNASPTLLPYIIAFIGVMGNIASDTAMVVIPPLAAIIYMGAGKHPVVGMLTGYAGAQAGFTANLMIAGTDALLQGITNTAIAGFLPDSGFQVDVTCNWFFMMASTFLCTLVIGSVSLFIIEPRFGKYTGSTDEKAENLSTLQSGALQKTGIAALIFLGLVIAGFFSGILSSENGSLIGSPLLNNLVPILFLFFSFCGAVYGFSSGAFKDSGDLHKAFSKQMGAMGSYVAFCFFAGQFQALFNWTKLGTMLAITGADFLENIGFTGMPLCIAFIVICTLVDLIFSSGSAKWAIFAPIFVPMFMLLGYHPAFTQLLYRLGDSPGNCIGPTSAYIWMMLSVIQTKYMKDAKIGTLISAMLPVALLLQIAWIIFMVVWVMLDIPIGPGVGVYLPAGVI